MPFIYGDILQRHLFLNLNLDQFCYFHLLFSFSNIQNSHCCTRICWLLTHIIWYYYPLQICNIPPCNLTVFALRKSYWALSGNHRALCHLYSFGRLKITLTYLSQYQSPRTNRSVVFIFCVIFSGCTGGGVEGPESKCVPWGGGTRFYFLRSLSRVFTGAFCRVSASTLFIFLSLSFSLGGCPSSNFCRSIKMVKTVRTEKNPRNVRTHTPTHTRTHNLTLTAPFSCIQCLVLVLLSAHIFLISPYLLMYLK